MTQAELVSHGNRLVFVGCLSIGEAERISTWLKSTMAGLSEVDIDCSSAQEVDLSFIQILLSARKTAEAEGKVLRMAAPASGPFLSALERVGLVGEAPTDEKAFWSASWRNE